MRHYPTFHVKHFLCAGRMALRLCAVARLMVGEIIADHRAEEAIERPIMPARKR